MDLGSDGEKKEHLSQMLLVPLYTEDTFNTCILIVQIGTWWDATNFSHC